MKGTERTPLYKRTELWYYITAFINFFHHCETKFLKGFQEPTSTEFLMFMLVQRNRVVSI